MIGAMLTAVLAANLAAALAVLVVLPLRPLMRPRLGARAAYALWIGPPLAALAALIPHRQAADNPLAPFVARAGQAAAQALPAPAAHALPGVAAGLLALWAAGAVMTALLLARRQAAFVSSLGRLSRLPGEDQRLVRAERTGTGPALIGAWRPRIVTPADFETRFAPDEQALILAHERTHLAFGDAAINALACAVQCLGWFNPLVHLAVRALRIDQELACDAEVLDRFPEARRLYGELLLKTQLATESLPLGCHWPPHAEHPLKERIAMLKAPQPARPERRAGLAVAALFGLAAATWAWTASAEAPKLVTQPDWVVKPVAADVKDVYPAKALKTNLGGGATIGCDVAADGKLLKCKVLKESPAGAGFGKAALKLSERFQMKPMSKDGVATGGGKVRIPIRFMIPGKPAPSA
ncbi:MAG: TonB family protein [Phenylobacterium sp.]|nr:MAG: TonB family protein [Phenylobacterium sp.]